MIKPVVSDNPVENYGLLPQILEILEQQGILDKKELTDKCFTECFKSKNGSDTLGMSIEKFVTPDDDIWDKVLDILNIQKQQNNTGLARVQKERLILTYVTNLIGCKVNLTSTTQEQELQPVYKEIIRILFQNQKHELTSEETKMLESVGKLLKVIRTHQELNDFINVMELTEGVIIPETNNPLIKELGSTVSEDNNIDFTEYIPKTCEEIMVRLMRKIFKGIFSFYAENDIQAEVIMYDFTQKYSGMKISISTKYIDRLFLPTHSNIRVNEKLKGLFSLYGSILSEENHIPVVALIRALSKKRLATYDLKVIKKIISEHTE